jgi:hypothetical protein
VNPTTYGDAAVIEAARLFLTNNPTAEINILSEEVVDRATHPFFLALDEVPELGCRVHLAHVPADIQRTYKFNFAVNERHDYRYESNRDSHEALVQFGGIEFAEELESTFQDLLRIAS